jgi:hypothetical protein
MPRKKTLGSLCKPVRYTKNMVWFYKCLASISPYLSKRNLTWCWGMFFLSFPVEYTQGCLHYPTSTKSMWSKPVQRLNSGTFSWAIQKENESCWTSQLSFKMWVFVFLYLPCYHKGRADLNMKLKYRENAVESWIETDSWWTWLNLEFNKGLNLDLSLTLLILNQNHFLFL